MSTAMTGRGKIQEATMVYEHKKHGRSLPRVGVNTFLPREHGGDIVTGIELIRSTPDEKGQQIDNVRNHQQLRNSMAPTFVPNTGLPTVVGATSVATANSGNTETSTAPGLAHLQKTACDRKNVYESLMEAVRSTARPDQPRAV